MAVSADQPQVAARRGARHCGARDPHGIGLHCRAVRRGHRHGDAGLCAARQVHLMACRAARVHRPDVDAGPGRRGRRDRRPLHGMGDGGRVVERRAGERADVHVAQGQCGQRGVVAQHLARRERRRVVAEHVPIRGPRACHHADVPLAGRDRKIDLLVGGAGRRGAGDDGAARPLQHQVGVVLQPAQRQLDPRGLAQCEGVIVDFVADAVDRIRGAAGGILRRQRTRPQVRCSGPDVVPIRGVVVDHAQGGGRGRAGGRGEGRFPAGDFRRNHTVGFGDQIVTRGYAERGSGRKSGERHVGPELPLGGVTALHAGDRVAGFLDQDLHGQRSGSPFGPRQDEPCRRALRHRRCGRRDRNFRYPRTAAREVELLIGETSPKGNPAVDQPGFYAATMKPHLRHETGAEGGSRAIDGGQS